MKYNRMLCLVNLQEKEALEKIVNKEFPIVFINNISEMKEQMNENDYLILSFPDTKETFIEIKNFLIDCHQFKFHFIDHLNGEGYSPEEFEILDIENAVSIPYVVKELLLEAAGKIDNIFQKRGIPNRRH